MSVAETEKIIEHLKNSYYSESDEEYSEEYFKKTVEDILNSQKTCEIILARLAAGKTRGDVLLYHLFAATA